MKTKRSVHNRVPDEGYRSDSGAIAVMVAIMFVVLLAMAAIVVDAGVLYAERRQLQTAADAAALAGVQELPNNPAHALSVADEYARLNTTRADVLTFLIASTWGPNDTIVAVIDETAVQLHLARLLGHNSAPVAATATAMVGSPRTYGSGVMPFGIIANGTSQSPYGYSTGGVIPLVVDNGSQDQGNWHYVDLTPFTDRASNTKSVIDNGGTTDPIDIGTIIQTQTGSPTTPNFKAMSDYLTATCPPHGLEGLAYDEERCVYEPVHAFDLASPLAYLNGTPCNRLLTCPVIVVAQGDPYDWDSVNGAKAMRVVGFLNMLISNDPDAKEGVLNATFVQVVPPDASAPGAYIPYGGVLFWLER